MSVEVIVERAAQLAVILAGSNLSGRNLDGPATVDALRRVGELRRLVDGLGADLVGRVEALWSSGVNLGERSPAVLLERNAAIPARDAQEWFRVGRALQQQTTLQGEVLPLRNPTLADAVRSGRITVGAADRILSTLDEIAPFASADDAGEVERFLVGAAPDLSDRQFAMVCRAIPSRFDPDGAEPREEELRQRSGVRVSRTRDGLVRWIVTMHPEAAGFLTAAIDARTAPRRQPTFGGPAVSGFEADRRPLSAQRLDALVSIARESLARDRGHVAGTSVTMAVTVTLDALRTGLGTAKIAGVDETISAATARRLAADAELIPVVLGSKGEQLDLGRTVRLATEPQRRALALRDQGCVWTGCAAPPGWCEVAHIVPWFRGGSTDLDNLALLCAFHHRCFDRDGWALETRDGVRYLIPPPWVDPARIPRRAGPLPTMDAA